MQTDVSGGEERTETALQGVAFGAVTNVAGRLLALARQLVITASFGLAAGLDAFFVAYAYVTMFVFPAGDLFDSVMLPALVKTAKDGGRQAHAAAAAAILRAALSVGVVLTVAIVLASPLARFLAPGASGGVVGEVWAQVMLLAPFALLFLVYRGLGSVLRSVRRFRLYYLGELVVAAAALAVLWPLRDHLSAVSLSLSCAFACGAIVLAVSLRHLVAAQAKSAGLVDWKALRAAALAAAPMYLTTQGHVIVDRFFASFLGDGGISALWFGLMLATIVPTMLTVESVFLTPLAESDERGELLSRIASGAILLGLPIMVFGFLEARSLIAWLLERGNFDAAAVALTADAFRWYALGVPALLFWPMLVRSLQIAGRFDWIVRLGVGSLALTATLDALAVFVFDAGVAGMAAVPACASLVFVPIGVWTLSRSGTALSGRAVLSSASVAIVAAVAAAASLFSPLLRGAGEPMRGVVFVLIYTVVVAVLPSREVTRLREMFEHSFPALRRVRRQGPRS